MSSIKKFLSVLLAIALVLTIWLGSIQLSNTKKIHNVFDEIYYSATQNSVFRTTWCSIKDMDVWHSPSIPEKDVFRYKSALLKSNANIAISFDRKNDNMIFVHSISFSSGDFPATLEIAYLYSCATKELRLHNVMLSVSPKYLSEAVSYDDTFLFFISDETFVSSFLQDSHLEQKDIVEYQHYALYEKLLPDWFAANEEKSRFSMDNLGTFTVIDNTFANIGENWA